MLEIRGLDVSIGQTPVLRRAALEIPTGEIGGLLGRNGAGKTTFLRSCMGLIASRNGHIRFEGHDLTAVPAARRAHLGIGYMPEDRRLIPDMSAEENILIPAWSTKLKDHPTRMSWIYEMIPEIVPIRRRPAASLSGGQQKLVALARALIVGRRLLLLDEPSEGVVPALAQRIVAILASLRRQGPTILIAESNGRYLAGLADRLNLIERGEIRAA